jgi:hypothetical protein
VAALLVVTQIDPSPNAIDTGESGSGYSTVEGTSSGTWVRSPPPAATLSTQAPFSSAAIDDSAVNSTPQSRWGYSDRLSLHPSTVRSATL